MRDSMARRVVTASDRRNVQVAPGMEVCYTVTFKPQDVRPYSAELVVVTEREKFIVSVGALGHRAALDFPDQVDRPIWVRSGSLCY